MTKPIIVVKEPCKLLYVIQVKEFLIKYSTSWPYLISEFLVAYITIVASDWPRTFFTPKVFLFSITFFKNCIFYININYSWLSHHGSPACSTVNNYLPAKSSGIMKLLYVINQKRHALACIDNRFSSEALN